VYIPLIECFPQEVSGEVPEGIFKRKKFVARRRYAGRRQALKRLKISDLQERLAEDTPNDTGGVERIFPSPVLKSVSLAKPGKSWTRVPKSWSRRRVPKTRSEAGSKKEAGT
jgi:hypothetical protein